MGLPDPTDVAAYDRALAAATIGEPRVLAGKIELRAYDPDWPIRYQREAARIRSVLGPQVIRLEHVGSTSVPGLLAKPIVDVVLEVPSAPDEAAYVPALESAGYLLRIREPDWFEHRLLKGPDRDLNLHVFSTGCAEIDRMILFRDWLRASADDRALYAATKQALAARDWTYVQQYADAKSPVVGEIMSRAARAP